MTTTVKPEDLSCASCACDYLKDCNGQITGSHLARVAQLFADHRVKAAEEKRGTLESIISEIVQHDKLNPSHGVGCACHDTHAGTLRCLFEREELYEPARGYNSPGKSLRNLLTVLGYIQLNP